MCIRDSHNLTARVKDIGGTLQAGTPDGTTYRLRAEIPLAQV